MCPCAQRSELGNSLGEANSSSDVADDGVGNAVLKPSNLGERVRELGTSSLQLQHVLR